MVIKASDMPAMRKYEFISFSSKEEAKSAKTKKRIAVELSTNTSIPVKKAAYLEISFTRRRGVNGGENYSEFL